MGSQATFSYTFAKPGKFDYVCSIHPYMHATVVVTQ
jgi:plastocyanin